jgi:hypothetical protein
VILADSGISLRHTHRPHSIQRCCAPVHFTILLEFGSFGKLDRMTGCTNMLIAANLTKMKKRTGCKEQCFKNELSSERRTGSTKKTDYFSS